MQYKSSSKSGKGYSLARVGFVLKMYLFCLSKQMRKNVIGWGFYLNSFSRHTFSALQSSSWSCLNISTALHTSSWWMRPGRFVGLLLPWERLEEARDSGACSGHQVWGASEDDSSEDSGSHCRKAHLSCRCCPIQAWAWLLLLPTPHGCLLCFPLPALRHTLSNTAKFFFFYCSFMHHWYISVVMFLKHKSC